MMAAQGVLHAQLLFPFLSFMQKRYRHEQILKLVGSQAIHTQEELADRLEKIGLASTQVTLSRDIHELGLVKTAFGYKELAGAANGVAVEGAAAAVAPVSGSAEARHLRRVAGEVLRDIRQAKNLLVVKTDTAGAQPLGLALDREKWPEVVGTIAGDDTILIVTPDNKAASSIRSKLLGLIGR